MFHVWGNMVNKWFDFQILAPCSVLLFIKWNGQTRLMLAVPNIRQGMEIKKNFHWVYCFQLWKSEIIRTGINIAVQGYLCFSMLDTSRSKGQNTLISTWTTIQFINRDIILLAKPKDNSFFLVRNKIEVWIKACWLTYSFSTYTKISNFNTHYVIESLESLNISS